LADVPNPASGQGGEPPADAPKFASLDDVKALARRFDAFAAEAKKSSGDMLAAFTAKLDELVSGAARAPAGSAPADDKSGAHAPSIEDHPTVKGLLKRIAEVEGRAKSAEDTAAAEKARARDGDMRRRLADALASHGIDGARAKHAVGFLVDAQKLVRLAEDGESILFKDADSGDVDLATGLKAWVKTEDGKLYKPPSGAAGSGDRPFGGAPQKPGEPISREAVGEMLLSHLRGGGRPA
jgi:hypothetical protein